MRTLSTVTSRRPFTLLGILLALLVIVAFVLVALNASQSANSPQQLVVVASKDLLPRIPITADALAVKSIPVPGTYPKVFFGRIQDVAGMIPLVSIQQGQAITANTVAKPNQALGSQSEYLPIPPGYVALTIPTSEQQGVADYIQPGDYISVIATVSAAGKVGTKTIFTQLHVIKVGTPGTAGGTSANSLTVVVTQCQAEIITWFLTYAALKYSLESYQDYSPGSQAPDPNCKTVEDAHGVTLTFIQSRYPSLFQ
ncbi:MAG TPA: Flp pilus assembly protein CpaB [Candidatus Sulfotelmatobacter sp.]|nr:Flp pilus assembly protein CpaB [Candidatus Sulfotelmatobacter sp.]